MKHSAEILEDAPQPLRFDADNDGRIPAARRLPCRFGIALERGHAVFFPKLGAAVRTRVAHRYPGRVDEIVVDEAGEHGLAHNAAAHKGEVHFLNIVCHNNHSF